MACWITYRVDDDLVGPPEQPVPDPFLVANVVVGMRDMVKALLARRKIRVTVTVGADCATMRAVQHALATAPPAGASTRDLLLHETTRLRQLDELAAHTRVRVDELLDAELAALRGENT